MQFMHNVDFWSAAVIKVSAAEFQRNIGRYQDLALTQAIAVTRNGRERTVLISVDEYQRLKRRDRQVLRLEDFGSDDIAALEATRAPDATKDFDSELTWSERGVSHARSWPRRSVQLPLGQ
jgi:prevent-host-death family protein